MWIVAAILSAVFAGATAILSKCGIKNANSDVATAVRTSVVLVLVWIIVFATGSYKTLVDISANESLHDIYFEGAVAEWNDIKKYTEYLCTVSLL